MRHIKNVTGEVLYNNILNVAHDPIWSPDESEAYGFTKGEAREIRRMYESRGIEVKIERPKNSRKL
jgi:hypothetical protein